MKRTIFDIEFDTDTRHGPNFFLVVVFSGAALIAIAVGAILLLHLDKKLVPDPPGTQQITFLHQVAAAPRCA